MLLPREKVGRERSWLLLYKATISMATGPTHHDDPVDLGVGGVGKPKGTQSKDTKVMFILGEEPTHSTATETWLSHQSCIPPF